MKRLRTTHPTYDSAHYPEDSGHLTISLLQPGAECFPPQMFSDHHIEAGDPTVSFGAALRRVRQYLELTQQAMSDLLGVDRNMISHWECDNGVPDPLRRAEIADALGIPRGVLLFGDPLPADDNPQKGTAA